MTINKKTIILFIILILSISSFIFSRKAYALEVGDVSYLEREDKGFYTIQRWNGDEWIYVTYSITNYVDENNEKRIAYCVNPNLKGIGYISGEFEGYNVELKNLIEDERCWRVLKNGYPYKTPDELGVETNQDAYLATKMALYAMLRNNDENDIRDLYRPGENKVAGQDMDETYRRGEKVIEAICSLVNIGNHDSETMQYSNNINIKLLGDFQEDKDNKEYYSQYVSVVSNVECTEYNVNCISGFPEGTIITDIKGNKMTTFKGGDEFKIMVPKKSLIEDITGNIAITGICKNYPIYYAECMDGDYQNYMLCCDMFSRNIEANSDISIKVKKSKLKIVKIDKDTKKAIEGVKFSIKYKDGQSIGTYTTDENGVIFVNNLHQGEIVIKEIENANEYKCLNNEMVVNVEYDDFRELTIENEIKKAHIKIIKIDADDNEARIEGAKFEVYNNLGEIVRTVVTDKNGEALVENLPINCVYTIKEIESAKDYILSNEVITIKLEENEIKNIKFKNKKNKSDEIQKLPRTGLANFDNILVLLVFFGVLIKKTL